MYFLGILDLSDSWIGATEAREPIQMDESSEC